nr:uncharacterized protein LOC109739385 [Aegilops tauschii subsp. strangulata]
MPPPRCRHPLLRRALAPPLLPLPRRLRSSPRPLPPPHSDAAQSQNPSSVPRRAPFRLRLRLGPRVPTPHLLLPAPLPGLHPSRLLPIRLPPRPPRPPQGDRAILLPQAHPQILVCDPVSRRTALLPPGMVTCTFSKLVSVVILSRDADDPAGSGLRFRAAVVTLEDTTLRAFVATFRDGKCHWECLLRSQARCNVDQLERHCVRASRFLIWHIRDEGAVLTFDPETLEFGFVLAPAALDMGGHFLKYRVGLMPDGRFCFGSMSRDHENLELRVLGPEPKDGENVWVLEREVCLLQAFDEMPQLPSSFIARRKCTWLSDMDAGRTGRVFIGTSGYGHYSYHLDTRKLERLVMDDGEQYGHPMFAYFSFPGSEGGSD